MKDSSRSQGLAICAGTIGLRLLFGIGLLSGAYWAVAIPVAALLAFVLGLTFWVGNTLATVAVEPEGDASAPQPQARDQRMGTFYGRFSGQCSEVTSIINHNAIIAMDFIALHASDG